MTVYEVVFKSYDGSSNVARIRVNAGGHPEEVKEELEEFFEHVQIGGTDAACIPETLAATYVVWKHQRLLTQKVDPFEYMSIIHSDEEQDAEYTYTINPADPVGDGTMTFTVDPEQDDD